MDSADESIMIETQSFLANGQKRFAGRGRLRPDGRCLVEQGGPAGVQQVFLGKVGTGRERILKDGHDEDSGTGSESPGKSPG